MSQLVTEVNKLRTGLKNVQEHYSYLNAYAQNINKQLGQLTRALHTMTVAQGVVELKEMEMSQEDFKEYEYLFSTLFMDKKENKIVSIIPILYGWELINSVSETEHIFGNPTIPSGDGMVKKTVYGPINEAQGKLSQLLRSEYYLERDKVV